MSFCKCGTGKQNLGVLGCFDDFSSVKKHIGVNIFDSQGNRNGILLSDLVDGKLTDAYILGKLNEDDSSKRWYLTPSTYENVEPSRTDSTYEDFSSGARVLIDVGVKAFLGVIPKTAGELAGKMNAGQCSLSGNYELDTSGSLKGEMSADGLELYPIQVAKGSFEAVEIEPIEGSAVQRIQVTFQYAKTVNESNLRLIASENIDVDLLKVNGALDGELEGTGSITTTTFSTIFGIDSMGAWGVVIPIEGQIEPSDWLVIDSALAVQVPTSVTETVAGTYDFVVPAMATGAATVKFVGIPDSATDQVYESNTLTLTVV
tara:strand:+ start:509 stop:1459 length:951 start_codon:yes stop_codon:yes gene_type:complete